MSWGTAEAVYGAIPVNAQPAPTRTGGPSPTPEHVTGYSPTSPPGVVSSPALWIVVLIAAAIGLISFSVKVGK
ncbi:MAG TPA: hypothetical protein VFD01_17020 [Candidatus Dormibacteraeota bacterium]|nr:hypothetical protein [Candidatus Dormibacteraeota bacterium]